jgi:hypothetical protein
MHLTESRNIAAKSARGRQEKAPHLTHIQKKTERRLSRHIKNVAAYVD